MQQTYKVDPGPSLVNGVTGPLRKCKKKIGNWNFFHPSKWRFWPQLITGSTGLPCIYPYHQKNPPKTLQPWATMVHQQKPLWDGYDINYCIPKKQVVFFCRKGFPSQNLFFCPQHVRLVKLPQHARRGVNIVFWNQSPNTISLWDSWCFRTQKRDTSPCNTKTHKKTTQKTVLL